MKAPTLRIVFMGTASFAVPSLSALIREGFRVVAIVTAPDNPKGRGRHNAYSPVKQYALENHLPLLQPTNLKSADFLDALKGFEPALQVVVAFRMLPKVVWKMPAMGTINLHASLLPEYRGAAPIHWAIINGEKKTGVTTFFIDQEIDTGKVILQEEEPIFDCDDFGSLHDRLMTKGAQLVCKTVFDIANDQYVPTSQHALSGLKTAPKLFKYSCRINWYCRVREIYNFVRGLNPHPGAWTVIDDKKFKVCKVSPNSLSFSGENTIRHTGEFVTDNKHYLAFRAADGWVSVEAWQPEGKKRMDIATFFRGNNISP